MSRPGKAPFRVVGRRVDRCSPWLAERWWRVPRVRGPRDRTDGVAGLRGPFHLIHGRGLFLRSSPALKYSRRSDLCRGRHADTNRPHLRAAAHLCASPLERAPRVRATHQCTRLPPARAPDVSAAPHVRASHLRASHLRASSRLRASPSTARLSLTARVDKSVRPCATWGFRPRAQGAAVELSLQPR